MNQTGFLEVPNAMLNGVPDLCRTPLHTKVSRKIPNLLQAGGALGRAPVRPTSRPVPVPVPWASPRPPPSSETRSPPRAIAAGPGSSAASPACGRASCSRRRRRGGRCRWGRSSRARGAGERRAAALRGTPLGCPGRRRRRRPGTGSWLPP